MRRHGKSQSTMDMFVVRSPKVSPASSPTKKGGNMRQATLESLKGVVVLEEMERAKVVLERSDVSTELKVDTLQHLLSKTPAKEVLIRTQLGKTVHNLCRDKDAEVAAVAQQVYASWKKHILSKENRPYIEVRTDLKTQRLRTSARQMLKEALQREIEKRGDTEGSERQDEIQDCTNNNESKGKGVEVVAVGGNKNKNDTERNSKEKETEQDSYRHKNKKEKEKCEEKSSKKRSRKDHDKEKNARRKENHKEEEKERSKKDHKRLEDRDKEKYRKSKQNQEKDEERNAISDGTRGHKRSREDSKEEKHAKRKKVKKEEEGKSDSTRTHKRERDESKEEKSEKTKSNLETENQEETIENKRTHKSRDDNDEERCAKSKQNQKNENTRAHKTQRDESDEERCADSKQSKGEDKRQEDSANSHVSPEMLAEHLEQKVYHKYNRLVDNSYRRTIRSLVFTLRHQKDVRKSVISASLSLEDFINQYRKS